MGEGSGQKVSDSSNGARNTGTLDAGFTGNPWGGSHHGGRALQYDGVDAAVGFGTMTQMNGVSALSASLWAKITVQDGRVSAFFHKQTSTDTNQRTAFCPSQATIGDDNDLLVLLAAGSNTYGYTTGNFLPLNVWTHCGFVFNGAGATNADRLKIYTNGVERAVTYNGTIPATAGTTTGNLVSGFYPLNSYFPGLKDNFMLWNRPLTGLDMRQLHAEPYAGFLTDDDSVYAGVTVPPPASTWQPRAIIY